MVNSINGDKSLGEKNDIKMNLEKMNFDLNSVDIIFKEDYKYECERSKKYERSNNKMSIRKQEE